MNSLFYGNFSSLAFNNIAIESSVLEEFPILNTCIKVVDAYVSLTRSPYVTIINGELVVNKPLIYDFNRGSDIYITPEPVYYKYKNNHTSQKNLMSNDFGGVKSWGEHRMTLQGVQYKYKYTYRRIKSEVKLADIHSFLMKKGYYKAASIWRQHKISQNNVLYFKTIKTDYKRYTKISNKLNDKYIIKLGHS